ncbi:MAG: ABC transporter substrate-binding protein [Pseudomonadota bacterium]
MTQPLSFLTAILALFALLLTFAATAKADIEEEADTFLTTMGNRAISELAESDASQAVKVQRLRALLNENIDMPLVAQQVLARNWRAATPEERQAFTIALRETLIVRFLPIFENYQGETFSVVSTRTSTRNENVVGAVTNLIAPNGEIARIEWFMRKTGSGMKIYDFSAEGIRLTTSLQDEYASVLRTNGNSVSDLTKRIEATLPATAVLN